MAEGTEMVKCPVCGMEIEVGSQVAKLYGAVRAAPRATTEYEGKEYHFCCKACKKKFDSEPEKYIKE
jgi:YHS domain-containing protein